MDLSTTVATTVAESARRTRLPGPDVVRAVALIGVVIMNYHGYLIIAGDGDRGAGVAADVFDPWTGPLATRFAATFVLTAGVGVTLLTGSATTSAAIKARRWTLARRGLVLFVAGWVIDEHWRGTILPYYGALFMLSSLLFRLRSAFLLAIGAVAAVAAALVAWWSLEARLDGRDTAWLLGADRWTPQGLFFDTFVNGTHPLLPWLAFFCAGMVLGRGLRTGWWRPACFGIGLTLFGLATMVSDSLRTGERAVVLASNDPFDRGLLYVASALGTALIAFAGISWLADRFVGSWPVEALRHAGAMTLSLYLLHIVVFIAAVGWFDLVEPAGLDAALTFAGGFWVVAMAAAWWYHRRFGIGPAEYVYRWLGG